MLDSNCNGDPTLDPHSDQNGIRSIEGRENDQQKERKIKKCFEELVFRSGELEAFSRAWKFCPGKKRNAQF